MLTELDTLLGFTEEELAAELLARIEDKEDLQANYEIYHRIIEDLWEDVEHCSQGVTKEIIKLARQQAIQKISIENKHYSRIAANLGFYLRSENDEYFYSPYSWQKFEAKYLKDTIKYQLGKKYWVQSTHLNCKLEKLYCQTICKDRDFLYDNPGFETINRKILDDGEHLQDVIFCNALIAASVEASEQGFLAWTAEFYDAISLKQVSQASPVFQNLRKVGGNAASCFITKIEDDLSSIFHEVTNLAHTSQAGGGAGINLSAVRSQGGTLRGLKNRAKGISPWINIINATAVAVDQAGKRAGAVTVALDIWHRDIEDFLELQTENGDKRKKAYDVFPQVVVCDLFMKAVEENTEWLLLDPHEVKEVYGVELDKLHNEEFENAYLKIVEELDTGKLELVKLVPAKGLMKNIMAAQVETGLPYIFFKDTVNRCQPDQHMGSIPNANLCVESYSTVKSGKYAHTCSLASINTALVSREELKTVVPIAVRFLDNVLSVTTAPFKESEQHIKDFRTIGLGVLGFADRLALENKSYAALSFINDYFATFAYHAIDASAELAKERGAYTHFEGSQWSKGILLNGLRNADLNMKTQARLIDEFDWYNLADKVRKTGVRNSTVMCIAPNTTTALIAGCSGSIIPVYNEIYEDKSSKGAMTTVAPYAGTHLYERFSELHPFYLIQAAAAIQTWIDVGISLELFFNFNKNAYPPNLLQNADTGIFEAVDIYNNIMYAWKMGIKAIYYIRSLHPDFEKQQQPQTECAVCAN
ncbi:MAG: ribonucleoside-diphosphate reductase subunit alpha [Xenococcaceae cyanobacterium]